MIKQFIDCIDVIERDTGVKVYYGFAQDEEKPTVPYITYVQVAEPALWADNRPYFSVGAFEVTLWTAEKDYRLERKLETALKDNDISYDKKESGFIDGADVFSTLYEV